MNLFTSFAPRRYGKRIFCTGMALAFLATAYSQKLAAPPPIRGPRSDNNTPHRVGLIFSGLHLTTTMLNPTGWGSTGNFAFASLSGTPKQSYGTIPDLALRTGVGFGDSRKTVSVVGIVNVNDVSAAANLKLHDLSYTFIASHDFGKWGSVSAGGIHLFADPEATDGIASGYVAYSYAPAGIRPVTPGNPRLSFTVGAGTGAFYKKAPADVIAGKGSYGTALFGSVSYDVVKNWSMNAEWTGLNLGLTGAYRLPKNIATIYAGVADLTRYSGDAPVFVFGVGKAIGFK